MEIKRGRCLGKAFLFFFEDRVGERCVTCILTGKNSTDPSSRRVRAMLEKYELFDFGAEEDKNFCRTVMYIRRCRG